MTTYKVGYLVGSVAKASINRLLATALVRLAPPELQMSEIPFKDLPIYSYDYDANYPPVATAFKEAIAAVDAVLFVTPEYNRSIPSILAFCNSPLMNAIEAYVQFDRGLITEDGRVTDETTEQFLRQYIEEFAGFIARVYTVLPRNQ